ncbi:hypothetical protein H9P43_004667 [Blastocladiella emersonii ATCC 22665]|nr:hypothetical protein H9P43_004667 [Blastocladiella emersonii ATCC 22665]
MKPLDSAKLAVLDLLRGLDTDDAVELLEFCDTLASFVNRAPEGRDHRRALPSSLAQLDQWCEARETLALLAEEVKAELDSPLATFGDECIVFPRAETKSSEFAEMSEETTVHVDGFLYDDDDIDALCDAGELERYRCTKCKDSSAMQQLDFISHSMTREDLEYLFLHYFGGRGGELDKLHVLDIGCRTGAVLYAAMLYSHSPRVMGIELSPSWAGLCVAVADRHRWLGPGYQQIEVFAGDVADHAHIVRDAGVIVMNNVFEFFSDKPRQRDLWTGLAAAWTGAKYFVAVPALHRQWKTCGWPREKVAEFDAQFAVDHRYESGEMEMVIYKRRAE